MEDNVTESGGTATGTDKVLHLMAGYSGHLLVSDATLERASKAQAAADATPYYDNFGELRRSGNLSFLEERLDRYASISVETYVEAIESTAGRTPATSDLDERLRAIADETFDGDIEAGAPDDSSGIYTDHEHEMQVEDVYTYELEQGMVDDVPWDLLSQFGGSFVPMFSGEVALGAIDNELLEPIIAALEERGYTIVR